MTEIFFVEQMNRLKNRFGAKAFDIEIMKVLAREIYSVGEDFFRRSVDNWIGMRKSSNPPLLVDFREMRLGYERSLLKTDMAKVERTFSTGLGDVLRRVYNVDTLEEAFELERMKIVLGEKDAGGIK